MAWICMIIPVSVRKVIENTGIAPRCVSTNDGYSSKKGRDAVLKIKDIEAVSMEC